MVKKCKIILFILINLIYIINLSLITNYSIGNGGYGNVVEYDDLSFTNVTNFNVIKLNIQNFLNKRECTNENINFTITYIRSRELFHKNYNYLISIGFNYIIYYKLTKYTTYKLTMTKSNKFKNKYYIIENIIHSNVYYQYNNSKKLKILNWNIWNYNQHWNIRLKLLIFEIKRLNPDIITFREVRFSEIEEHLTKFNNFHQVEDLVEELNHLYPYFSFKPAMSYETNIFKLIKNSIRNEEGLAVFCKFPIIDLKYLLLSRNLYNFNSHQRIMIHATIIHDKIINIFNTHLSLEEEMIYQNSNNILHYINDSNIANPSILLTGDLNTEFNSKGYNNLVTYFKDSWLLLYKSLFGYTFNTQSTTIRKRIDFGLIKNLNLFNIHVIGNTTESQKISDHCGLYMIFN